MKKKRPPLPGRRFFDAVPADDQVKTISHVGQGMLDGGKPPPPNLGGYNGHCLSRIGRVGLGVQQGAKMVLFSCPYLGSEVELTDEREQHIVEQHPDLLPAHRQKIADTLAEPDQVRRSARFGSAQLFSRWFAELRGGKHVVVVVVSHYGSSRRHWIITAYIARKLAGGEVEWRKN